MFNDAQARVKENNMATSSARLLRLPAVIEATGLCRTAIYQLEKDGDFPARVAIGKRSVAWREDQVADWIESRQRKTAA